MTHHLSPATNDLGRTPSLTAAPPHLPTIFDDIEADDVARRLEAWRTELCPSDPHDDWLVLQAVVMSLRVEQLQAELQHLHRERRQRAALCWDADRRLAAERLGARLSRNPSLVSRELTRTLQGCDWLLERWEGLSGVLDQGRPWSSVERRLALDLKGIPKELHDAPSPFDLVGRGPAEADAIEACQTAVLDEMERLEQLRKNVLEPLDDLDRRAAETGLALLLDPVALRLEREEASCHRRMLWALTRLRRKDGASHPAENGRVISRALAPAPVLPPAADRTVCPDGASPIPARNSTVRNDGAASPGFVTLRPESSKAGANLHGSLMDTCRTTVDLTQNVRNQPTRQVPTAPHRYPNGARPVAECQDRIQVR